MDSNVSPIVPRPIVVPVGDQHGRNKQGQDGSQSFELADTETPPVEPESPSAERNSDGELPVGHAERDEVGRRLDVTG